MTFNTPYETETNVFGKTLAEMGQRDERINVFDADLSPATETGDFSSLFPDRYFNVGIAEANMVSMAAGFSLYGKISFCGTFATFMSRRACDQISVSAALNDTNVRLIAMEPGLASGRNGASHQAVDDLAIVRACPKMSVIDPADSTEAKQVLWESLKHTGPVYLRMLRGPTPIIFDPEQSSSEWGKAKLVKSGTDVTLISTGIMLKRTLEAEKVLADEGIQAEILHIPYIKPLDEAAIIESAKRTGAVVTAENHNILGGLGGAVSEVLSGTCPVPVIRIGIPDRFGQCGEPDDLFKEYNMSAEDIVRAAKKSIALKA